MVTAHRDRGWSRVRGADGLAPDASSACRVTAAGASGEYRQVNLDQWVSMGPTAQARHIAQWGPPLYGWPRPSASLAPMPALQQLVGLGQLSQRRHGLRPVTVATDRRVSPLGRPARDRASRLR